MEISSIIKLISNWHRSFLVDFFIITYAGQCVLDIVNQKAGDRSDEEGRELGF